LVAVALEEIEGSTASIVDRTDSKTMTKIQ